MKRNKKAFTLIELVSVLVILAILALIVTPLVLNIIRKARTAADKRSIDAYGRSIELAVADYLLDNGTFPTSIGELTIEYSGDTVLCSTTQLNDDSSVYLSGCTVGNRAVEGYTYGTDKTPAAPTYEAYTVGQEVTYKNISYYVVSPSDTSKSSVTLLKATPLTVAEVNEYGTGHVNMYVTSDTNASYYQKAYDQNGYGGMAYYSSTSCGYNNNNSWHDSGCTSDYAQSEIKYVVDAWAAAKTTSTDLVEDSTGYSARLLTFEELTTSLGYTAPPQNVTSMSLNSETVPSFVYNNNYWYWTMDPKDDASDVWFVSDDGNLHSNYVTFSGGNGAVRPVIVLSKSAL